MEKKKALIVDDSKLARFVLKEMLHEYGLEADTTESAEEALGYLCTQRPDVIFMDHTMPGMDGFKAVEAIKQDPQTTAIPIMMYTSKEGEMYVSQARALGAIGVLPKQLKSVQLGQVLQKLNLIPRPEGEPGEPEPPVLQAVPDYKPSEWDNGNEPEGSTTTTVNKSTIDLEEAVATAEEAVPDTVPKAVDESISLLPVQDMDVDVLENLAHDAEHSAEVNLLKPLLEDMLQDMFSQQRKLIQQDIRKSAVSLGRRLAGESIDPDVDEDIDEVYVPPARPRYNFAVVALIVVLVPFVWLIYQYNSIGDRLAELQQENEYLQALNLDEENQLLTEELIEVDNSTDTQFLALEAKHERENRALLDAIEWAVNNDNTVPFGESPLGDKALEILSTLIPKLIDTEFRGTLVLKSHNAEFCVVEDASGETKVPASDLAFKDCKLVEPGMTESIEFTNYLATLRESGYRSIQVRVDNRGASEPRFPYPLQSEVQTAGEWNAIARLNNRIEIDLEHDPKGIALN